MKLVVPSFVLLVAASACRATPTSLLAARNALPGRAPITEVIIPEFAAPEHVRTAPPLKYPAARRTDQTDTYFGTAVADPYRWLESLDTPETKDWVTAENEVTFGYLGQIPFRDKIRERLTTMWNFERYSVPSADDGKLYFSKNDGLQNQAVVYVQADKPGATPEVLLDPNKLSADGTTALAGFALSNNHRYLAYATSGGGSDWQKVYVMDLATRKLLPEVLDWVKVSGFGWAGNGFYYSRYDAPKAGENSLAGKNEFHKVYYHQVGTAQSADRLVYEDPKTALGFRTADVTEDERFLVLSLTDGKADGNRLQVRDLTDPKQAKAWTTILPSYEFNNNVLGTAGGRVLVYTNYRAPRYRVVAIDPKNPAEANWQVIIPESTDKLESVSQVGGRLVADYLHDASTQVKVFDEAGKFLHDVKFPAIGTAGGFGGKRTDKVVYYSFTSFTYPTTIYKYDLSSNVSTVFQAPKVDVNPADYVTTQVFYPSKDGTKIPMFITHKKGLALDGKNPTYLYAYGGFNISLTPGFSIARMLWLENGGILAIPNLRGGGEYGEDWHKAGMTPRKQNVFDDFIAAAEYLKANRYTDTDHLALAGGSNGGLLVGATMTQRPDLARVALPAVGVMDMLRYQTFTIGWNWAPEYGTVADRTQFESLIKFSPLHNLRPAAYPATMVTTADHDDRVVPAHSFKFAAALQAANTGPRPQLIRIDVNAGHGAGKSTKLQIQEWADVWSFCWASMGVVPAVK